jgi:hypothetical protein
MGLTPNTLSAWQALHVGCAASRLAGHRRWRRPGAHRRQGPDRRGIGSCELRVRSDRSPCLRAQVAGPRRRVKTPLDARLLQPELQPVEGGQVVAAERHRGGLVDRSLS